jgi:hypothetical protein
MTWLWAYLGGVAAVLVVAWLVMDARDWADTWWSAVACAVFWPFIAGFMVLSLLYTLAKAVVALVRRWAYSGDSL